MICITCCAYTLSTLLRMWLLWLRSVSPTATVYSLRNVSDVMKFWVINIWRLIWLQKHTAYSYSTGGSRRLRHNCISHTVDSSQITERSLRVFGNFSVIEQPAVSKKKLLMYVFHIRCPQTSIAWDSLLKRLLLFRNGPLLQFMATEKMTAARGWHLVCSSFSLSQILKSIYHMARSDFDCSLLNIMCRHHDMQ